MRVPIVSIVAALLAAGCGSAYTYSPAEHATASILGQTAAHYDVPPGAAAQGDLRIASFGVSKIKPKEGNESMRALQVRMIVANNSSVPWTVDTRQQQAVLDSGQRLTPLYASSDAPGLPIVQVPPSGQRTIDLFYPLPPGEQKASRIPGFDVLWRIDAGGRVVAERTPFDRLLAEPTYAYGWGPGFGYWGAWPYYWYDPFWGPGYAPNWASRPVVFGRPTWRSY